MTLVRKHLDRCRHDHPVRCATIGLGLYGALTLAVVAHAALSSVLN